MKELLVRESAQEPVLLVFEDLHWVDGGTQDWLDGLVEAVPAARIALLVNYRPEYRHGWGSRTYYNQVRADPLRPDSAEALLDGLLGMAPDLQPLKRSLIERTDGNPLFLEETIRTLVETRALVGEVGARKLVRPLEETRVPSTVQAVLAARIDRLDPDDKRVLQAASVIGKDVPFRLLEAIADIDTAELRTRIDRLQTAELLYETGSGSGRGYVFKHALSHEVAYASLLQDRRRALHRAIAVAIEATYEGRLAEHIERLADHAVRAQDWDRAVNYLYQAGQKALARSAGHEAVGRLEAVLGAVEQLASTADLVRIAIDVRLLLRQALRFSGDLERTERYLREAATLAEEIDDNVRRARSVVGLANLRWNQGDLTSAIDYALEARGLGQAADDPSITTHASVVLMYSWHCQGDFERAETSGYEVLGLAPRLRRDGYYGHLVPPAAAARTYLAIAHAEQGRFAAAIGDGEAALRLAEESSQPFTMGIATWGLGYVHRLCGNFDDARVVLQRGFDIAKEWKLEWWLAYLGWLLGHVEALSARPEGLPRLREALDRFEVRGFGANRSLVIVNLGEAHLEKGDVRAAQDSGRKAVMRARELGERGYEAWALRLLGDCAAVGGDVQESGVFYQQARLLAVELGMRPVIAHCHLGLGKHHQRADNLEQAREHLATATTMYREMGMRFWLEQADAELAGLR